MSSSADHPLIAIKPPRLYAAGLMIGLLIHLMVPLDLFAYWVQFAFGIPLIVAGLGLGYWGISTLRAAGTGVPVDEAVTALVTGGPYAYLRNPLYLALSLIYTGIAVLFDWPAVLLILIVILYLIQTRVIAAEEKFLDEKFGDDYRAYCRRVKRWGRF